MIGICAWSIWRAMGGHQWSFLHPKFVTAFFTKVDRNRTAGDQIDADFFFCIHLIDTVSRCWMHKIYVILWRTWKPLCWSSFDDREYASTRFDLFICLVESAKPVWFSSIGLCFAHFNGDCVNWYGGNIFHLSFFILTRMSANLMIDTILKYFIFNYLFNEQLSEWHKNQCSMHWNIAAIKQFIAIFLSFNLCLRLFSLWIHEENYLVQLQQNSSKSVSCFFYRNSAIARRWQIGATNHLCFYNIYRFILCGFCNERKFILIQSRRAFDVNCLMYNQRDLCRATSYGMVGRYTLRVCSTCQHTWCGVDGDRYMYFTEAVNRSESI